MNAIRRGWEVLQSEGVASVLVRTSNRVRPPTPLAVSDLLDERIMYTSDPSECVAMLAEAAGCEPPTSSMVQGWIGEWERAIHLAKDIVTEIPQEWNIEVATSQVLYSLVRWRRPRLALETGIARGASSWTLLQAMEANGYGSLHSVDVMSDVGQLVPSELHSRWSRHIVDPSHARAQFLDILDSLDELDFFFHDSDHNERWMQFELSAVKERVESGCIVGADDVQANRAFMKELSPAERGIVLLDSRKAAGFSVSSK